MIVTPGELRNTDTVMFNDLKSHQSAGILTDCGWLLNIIFVLKFRLSSIYESYFNERFREQLKVKHDSSARLLFQMSINTVDMYFMISLYICHFLILFLHKSAKSNYL